ncbi:MAG: hypothetical protein LBC41_09035 [Clostridiales bacterium]|jgi:hypothetical protein|nr:hypothetical protein [Clostridiales bacterium]
MESNIEFMRRSMTPAMSFYEFATEIRNLLDLAFKGKLKTMDMIRDGYLGDSVELRLIGGGVASKFSIRILYARYIAGQTVDELFLGLVKEMSAELGNFIDGKA